MFKCIKNWFTGNSKDSPPPTPRRQSMFSMEKDFSPEVKTKLPGDDGAIISIPPVVDKVETLED